MDLPEMKYPIGHKYTPRRKHTYECTVIEYRFTFNSTGYMTHSCYVSSHKFCGQIVIEYDVIQTTIDRSTL